MVLVMFFSPHSSLITNYLNSIIHRADSVHPIRCSLMLIRSCCGSRGICFWSDSDGSDGVSAISFPEFMFCYVIVSGHACFFEQRITPYSLYKYL